MNDSNWVQRFLFAISFEYIPLTALLAVSITGMAIGLILSAPLFSPLPPVAGIGILLGAIMVYASLPFAVASVIVMILWVIFRKWLQKRNTKPPAYFKKHKPAAPFITEREARILHGQGNLFAAGMCIATLLMKISVVLIYILTEQLWLAILFGAIPFVLLGWLLILSWFESRRIWGRAHGEAESN